jgi:hypothetical protein
MIDPAEANETYRAASAIAAFDAVLAATRCPALKHDVVGSSSSAAVRELIIGSARSAQRLRPAFETPH